MPRSLNDIIPPSRRRMRDDSVFADLPPEPPESAPAPRAPRRRFPYGTAILAVLVIVICAGALYAFAGAKVEITPTTKVATISGDFTATPATGDLPYEVITVDKTASQAVPAESTVNANDPAQGQITIYNEQATAQKLITNTRFATPDGLIFRIHSPVTVPAGSASAPGTVTVTVFADQGGANYNVGPVDRFTLPGLKGGKSYNSVYAKSSAPMTGGFSGTRPSVGTATDDKTHAALQASLQNDLLSAVQGKITEGYILVPGATFTTYAPQPDTAGDKNAVNVSVKGTLTAVIFPNDALAKAVAYKAVGTYAGEPVTLSDASKLTLAPALQTPPGASDSFAFSLSGSTTIAWKVDQTKIAGAVAGKTRASAQVILSGLPEVDKAVLILRPFWTSTFPSDPAHITITVAGDSAKK